MKKAKKRYTAILLLLAVAAAGYSYLESGRALHAKNEADKAQQSGSAVQTVRFENRLFALLIPTEFSVEKQTKPLPGCFSFWETGG